MTFLRNILHDLVEKRLWPVALALVLALVAIPVLLGRSGAPASAPVAAAPAVPGHSGQAAVSLDTTTATGENRRAGKVRNPFAQPKLKGAKAAAPAHATGAPAGGASKDATTGTGVGTGGGGPSTGLAPPSSPPVAGEQPAAPDALDTFRLTLRFGQAGSLRTMRDLARLSPLPSDTNPFFVYLGVLKDEKTAAFLVSSDVTATGDGKCRPSAKDCETVEVKEGDTEFFDMQNGGKPVQYEMDVLHLDKTSDAQKQVSAAAARTAASRHSKAGAATLRHAHTSTDPGYNGMDGYRWLPDRGVLVRVPAATKASTTSGAPVAARKPLPGLPVWHAELTG